MSDGKDVGKTDRHGENGGARARQFLSQHPGKGEA